MSQAVKELRKRLESTELFKHLQDDVQKTATRHVFDIAQTRLLRVDELYHDYTSHGMNHAIRTIENLSYLMVKCNILERLTHPEVFLLICATLMHDIGMGPITDTEMANFVSGRISPAIKTFWRKEHHNRTRDFITTSQDLSHIENELKERIGDIARGHREVNLLRSDDFFSNPVDCFLGASLRLADQMDLSPERVHERLITQGVLNVLSQTVNTDEEQNQLRGFLKNFAQKKWQLIFLEELPVITLDSEIPVDELTIGSLEALESLINDIEDTLEEIKDVPLHGETILPRSLHYSFHVQGEASKHHILRANLPRVWEYLNVYMYRPEDRPKIAIREALANAIDACSIQMNIDPSSECCVHVKHLEDRIVIEDNGIGMSLRTIEENLKSLGSSFYDSPSFRSNPTIQRPISIIGQFGIGVFSYLLVCDHFEIVTSDSSESSFRILMSNRFGITIENSTPRTCGTTLTLFRSKKDHWSLDNAEVLFDMIQKLYPRPKIKIIFEDDSSPREIGLWRATPEESIHTSDGLTRIRFISEGAQDRLEYGIQLDMTISSNSIPKSPDAVITFYNAFSSERASSGTDTFPTSVLFEGMNVHPFDLSFYPFTFTLISLARLPNSEAVLSAGITVNVSLARLWIDFPADLARIDLSKMTIKSHTSLNSVMDSLEEMCRRFCLEILLNDEIDWIVKERIRWAFITRLQDSDLINYSVDKLTDDSVIENFIAPIVCLDGRSRDYISFGDVLNSSQETGIILWPVGNHLPWAIDAALWKRFRPFYALDYLRRRTKIQSVVGGVLGDIKKAAGKDWEKMSICLFPIGDSANLWVMKNLKDLARKKGHTFVITNEKQVF